MRKGIRKAVAMFLASLLVVGAGAPMRIEAATRKTDVTKPSSGNTLVYVDGTFKTAGKTTALKRINQIRKEACTKGYIDPDTQKKLKPSDYRPIKWSTELEWIAQTRAAEATVTQSHARPNGNGCFSVKHNGVQSWGEVLAWNYSGMMQGIEQWYGEKEDWVNQNTSAVTGHYTQMIDPKNTYIGLGAFVQKQGGWIAVAGEFMSDQTAMYMGLKNVSEKETGIKGAYKQAIEVPRTSVKGKMTPKTMKKGSSQKMNLTLQITGKGFYGNENIIKVSRYGSVKWTSSNTSIATVSAQGVVRAKRKGSVLITAELNGKKKVKCTITIN